MHDADGGDHPHGPVAPDRQVPLPLLASCSRGRPTSLDPRVDATSSPRRRCRTTTRSPTAGREGWLVERGSETDLRPANSAAHAQRADRVIRITSDCPLIDPDVIDAVVGH
jgi:hypothetical protein